MSSMSLIIRIVIMLICVVLAIVGLNKQKEGKEWGKPLATVAAIIATLAALWGIVKTLDGSDMKEARDRELEFQRIQTRVLGEYLAQNFAGKKLVVLVDPMIYADYPGAPTEKLDPSYEGLKQGLNGKLEIVKEIFPEIPKNYLKEGPKDPNGVPMDMMIPPMEMWFNAKELNKILPKENTYDIFLSLVSLPAGTMGVCPSLKKKKMAMVGGDTSIYGALFQNNIAVAAVVHNPKAVYDEKPIPRKQMDAFNKRYMMLTKDNFKEIIKNNSQMFAPMR